MTDNNPALLAYLRLRNANVPSREAANLIASCYSWTVQNTGEEETLNAVVDAYISSPAVPAATAINNNSSNNPSSNTTLSLHSPRTSTPAPPSPTSVSQSYFSGEEEWRSDEESEFSLSRFDADDLNDLRLESQAGQLRSRRGDDRRIDRLLPPSMRNRLSGGRIAAFLESPAPASVSTTTTARRRQVVFPSSPPPPTRAYPSMSVAAPVGRSQNLYEQARSRIRELEDRLDRLSIRMRNTIASADALIADTSRSLEAAAVVNAAAAPSQDSLSLSSLLPPLSPPPPPPPPPPPRQRRNTGLYRGQLLHIFASSPELLPPETLSWFLANDAVQQQVRDLLEERDRIRGAFDDSRHSRFGTSATSSSSLEDIIDVCEQMREHEVRVGEFERSAATAPGLRELVQGEGGIIDNWIMTLLELRRSRLSSRRRRPENRATDLFPAAPAFADPAAEAELLEALTQAYQRFLVARRSHSLLGDDDFGDSNDTDDNALSSYIQSVERYADAVRPTSLRRETRERAWQRLRQISSHLRQVEADEQMLPGHPTMQWTLLVKLCHREAFLYSCLSDEPLLAILLPLLLYPRHSTTSTATNTTASNRRSQSERDREEALLRGRLSSIYSNAGSSPSRRVRERIPLRRVQRNPRPYVENDEELAWRLQLEEFQQGGFLASGTSSSTSSMISSGAEEDFETFPASRRFNPRRASHSLSLNDFQSMMSFGMTPFMSGREEEEERTPRGLTSRQISLIPVLKTDLRELIDCSICLMGLNELEDLRDIPCKHRFHMHCLDLWLAQNRTCPICRGPVIEAVVGGGGE